VAKGVKVVSLEMKNGFHLLLARKFGKRCSVGVGCAWVVCWTGLLSRFLS